MPHDSGQTPGGPAGTPAPSVLAYLRSTSRPLVVKVKAKKQYSSSLKGLQRSMGARSRAQLRVVSALAAGIENYRDRAEDSALRKRDGELKDFWKNSARATRVVLKKARKLPSDLADVAEAEQGPLSRSLLRGSRVVRWLSGSR